MSRIPQSSSSSRTSIKTPTTPLKSRGTVTSSSGSSRIRTQSQRSATPAAKPVVDAKTLESTPAPLSIKEAIALRRAEAKKAQSKTGKEAFSDLVSLEDASPTPVDKQEEGDILGRLPIRETIERARSTGGHIIFTLVLG